MMWPALSQAIEQDQNRSECSSVSVPGRTSASKPLDMGDRGFLDDAVTQVEDVRPPRKAR